MSGMALVKRTRGEIQQLPADVLARVTLTPKRKALAGVQTSSVEYRSLIRATIEEQLRFEPETVTRNRKQLERPIDLGARWELRLGPDNCFRVFYPVDPERQVRILAIAVKERNRVTEFSKVRHTRDG